MGQPIVENSTLLNAQLAFLKTHLAIIHLPSSAYPLFLQPILTLLLHNDRRDADDKLIEPRRCWNYWHPFVNVSITPHECSIVCPRAEAERLFAPPALGDELSPAFKRAVSISTEDYAAIMIGGEGLDAGQRVLDLTSPLALAGIPIFFLTSYYADYILVPFSARAKVIGALEERGFVFEAADADGEAGQMTNPASPLLHHRQGSSASFEFPFLAPTASTTPPPASVSELQERTFKLLAQHRIQPHVDPGIELVTCAGSKSSVPATASSSGGGIGIGGGGAAHFTAGQLLQLGLAKCLSAQPAPRFFSVTLTDSESASLTLERRLLRFFPPLAAGHDVLLGVDGPSQIPITLDLHHLPLESTGIVCGVSSRLIESARRRGGGGSGAMFNMSYLSTSRAGHVIVYEDELDDAIEALKGAQQNSS